MAPLLTRTLLTLTLLLLSTILQKAGGEFEQWCVADEQTPDDELQMALDWTCGRGGANCRKIQPNQPCFSPNIVKDHASFAFNTFFQNFKHQRGSCFFKGAAIITELDPSHGCCQYEFIPQREGESESEQNQRKKIAFKEGDKIPWKIIIQVLYLFRFT